MANARQTALRALPRLGLVLFFGAGLSGAAKPGSNPACIEISGEVRYGNAGYDHIVHILNRCKSAAVCDVATDVNPEPARVAVPPSAHVEVLTFRGSPAREFSIHAECRLTG